MYSCSLRLSVAHSAIDHPPLGHLLLYSWGGGIYESDRGGDNMICNNMYLWVRGGDHISWKNMYWWGGGIYESEAEWCQPKFPKSPEFRVGFSPIIPRFAVLCIWIPQRVFIGSSRTVDERVQKGNSYMLMDGPTHSGKSSLRNSSIKAWKSVKLG